MFLFFYISLIAAAKKAAAAEAKKSGASADDKKGEWNNYLSFLVSYVGILTDSYISCFLYT